jgi:hypothetical protein
MNTGLTIAFICNGDKHPTVINYNLFGNKYWDDTHNNNSKIGYYFVYYFQQKFVYVHKIVNILQPIDRPSDMIWDSNRQILCLSKQIKKFTWNEWISGIGAGAPYTPNYRMTQTGSWSYSELQKKYNTFNFIYFKNTIDQQPANIAINYVEDAIVEEENNDEAELMRKMEIERKAMEERMTHLLKNINEKKIVRLREIKCDELKIQMSKYQYIIDEANVNQYKIEQEINAIMRGDQDAEFIKKNNYKCKLTIEL